MSEKITKKDNASDPCAHADSYLPADPNLPLHFMSLTETLSGYSLSLSLAINVPDKGNTTLTDTSNLKDLYRKLNEQFGSFEPSCGTIAIIAPTGASHVIGVCAGYAKSAAQNAKLQIDVLKILGKKNGTYQDFVDAPQAPEPAPDYFSPLRAFLSGLQKPDTLVA